MELRHQIGVQFDGERNQSERLIAFALFAPVQDNGRTLAETAWRGGLMHLVFYFFAFGFFQLGFFQGRSRIRSKNNRAGATLLAACLERKQFSRRCKTFPLCGV
jgi:hypothetical protein